VRNRKAEGAEIGLDERDRLKERQNSGFPDPVTGEGEIWTSVWLVLLYDYCFSAGIAGDEGGDLE
jgi:hypothetical protein